MKQFMQALNKFVFPHGFLSSPEYSVSRNLMPWDSMVRNIS